MTAFLTIAFLAAPPILSPGMAAPKLEVAGWLKHAPPAGGGRRLRVVEFWATWCGPCKTSIPNLTKLARKYRDEIDVVGVSVWERPSTTVGDLRKFVAGFGEKMDYRVAYDTANQTMARTWLAAAGQKGIPSSFLLDGSGTILWIGHPDRLEPVVVQALAGTLNVTNAKDAFLAAAAQERRKREERDQAIAKVAAIGERYMAGERSRADAEWNVLADESEETAALVLDARLMVYRYVYGRGEYDAVERSWKTLAEASPSVRDRIDDSRKFAYADRYRSGDREGAEKAWADLEATASPKVVAAIEIERLRAYPADSTRRKALLEKMLAGTKEEREAVKNFLRDEKARSRT